jgi:hypothetical protein
MTPREQLEFIHDMQRQISVLLILANSAIVLGFVSVALCWLGIRRPRK